MREKVHSSWEDSNFLYGLSLSLSLSHFTAFFCSGLVVGHTFFEGMLAMVVGRVVCRALAASTTTGISTGRLLLRLFVSATTQQSGELGQH